MAINGPQCGAEYDVTLFTFGRRLHCDCGAWVDLKTGHEQKSQGGKEASQQSTNSRSSDEPREE
jgi:hypothetical protein